MSSHSPPVKARGCCCITCGKSLVYLLQLSRWTHLSRRGNHSFTLASLLINIWYGPSNFGVNESTLACLFRKMKSPATTCDSVLSLLYLSLAVWRLPIFQSFQALPVCVSAILNARSVNSLPLLSALCIKRRWDREALYRRSACVETLELNYSASHYSGTKLLWGGQARPFCVTACLVEYTGWTAWPCQCFYANVDITSAWGLYGEVSFLFTRYIEVQPLKDQHAKRLVKAFEQGWIYRGHGVPQSILSDQGQKVVWETFREFCRALGVNKKLTSP